MGRWQVASRSANDSGLVVPSLDATLVSETAERPCQVELTPPPGGPINCQFHE